MNNLGVISMGLHCPIIKEGDSIKDIAMNILEECVNDGCLHIDDKDVLCITESIVARSQGNYVTVDNIVKFLNENDYKKHLILESPIMSRNRFSVILRAFARFADSITVVLNGKYDEQGNPNYGVNQFTGVDIQEYYKQICTEENCTIDFIDSDQFYGGYVVTPNETFIDCHCHPESKAWNVKTLKDIMSSPVNCDPIKGKDGSYLLGIRLSGYNPEWGVLGSNKSNDETLKLFPLGCKELCNEIKNTVKEKYGKDIEVLVYGDGCFKDPVGGIWEFADPVTCPGYTEGLNGTPNELKLKALADDKFGDLRGDELKEAILNEIKTKDKDLVGSMASQGTTPRRYIDLLASLADLTSGSGDKGTPMVYIKNYFKTYASN